MINQLTFMWLRAKLIRTFLVGLGAFGPSITATGSMTAARYLHTAILLADGRVLIAGGERIELNPFLSVRLTYLDRSSNQVTIGAQ